MYVLLPECDPNVFILTWLGAMIPPLSPLLVRRRSYRTIYPTARHKTKRHKNQLTYPDRE